MTFEEQEKWIKTANVCRNCIHAFRRNNFYGGYNWCGYECLISNKKEDYKRLDETCDKFEWRKEENICQ